jgi:hypothetical protein
MLIATGLIDQGYVSAGFLGPALDWGRLLNETLRLHSGNEPVCKLLEDNTERILNTGPLILDDAGDDLTRNQASLTSSTDYLYQDTYFSVVTETNGVRWPPLGACWGGLTGAGRMLSEKTFKPIAQRHPFILVSIAKSLEALRSIGYRTFSPWIDERYDDEEDDATRMIMIMTEIKRLCDMTAAEVSTFISNVKPICTYNYIVLSNKDYFC